MPIDSKHVEELICQFCIHYKGPYEGYDAEAQSARSNLSKIERTEEMHCTLFDKKIEDPKKACYMCPGYEMDLDKNIEEAGW